MSNTLDQPEGSPTPPPHPREIDRLASLCGLPLVEGHDVAMDEIARQAAAICGTPFGTVTLVQEHEQVLIGNQGMPGAGCDRNEAICAYTILQQDPLVVEDASLDHRFAHYAVVRGSPFLRFYVGAPILDRNGLPLGSVCALGTVSREIGAAPLFSLQRLAAMAGVLLESRRLAVELLGPGASDAARIGAISRLDGVMAPLFGRPNGFRRSPFESGSTRL